MLKRTFAFFLLLLVASISRAHTIYIVYPEGSSTYQGLARQLEAKVTEWQNANNNFRDTITVNNDQVFSMRGVEKGDLIINLNNATLNPYEDQDTDILYTFANPTTPSTINNSYIYINQPLERMLEAAKKTIKTQFNNTVLIIVSENNKAVLSQLNKLKNSKQIKVISIKEGDIAAKVIEKEFYTAGAIVALYDPLIWSGNSARWLLQQAYNYKVPIIGYSKAFLKAGAMVSVYSTAENIIQASYDSTIDWINSGKFSQHIHYPAYNVEVNINIARALGFSESEIIAIGEKQ